MTAPVCLNLDRMKLKDSSTKDAGLTDENIVSLAENFVLGYAVSY